MVKGAWPLSLLNMYSIQLVALQAAASFPHRSPRALSLLEGASTSLQALYMAGRGTGGRQKHSCCHRGRPQRPPCVTWRQDGAATVHKGSRSPLTQLITPTWQIPVTHTIGRKPVLPGAHAAQRHPPSCTEEPLRLRMDSQELSAPPSIKLLPENSCGRKLHWNKIVFLLSRSDYALQMYRNTLDICVFYFFLICLAYIFLFFP